MPILYIQDIQDIQDIHNVGMKRSAEALNKVEQGMVLDFKDFKDFKDFQSNTADITNITLLAHTDDKNTSIGGFTPEELAENFASKIFKINRSRVEHVYLISCGAGMFKEGKIPLALRFVQKMYDLGFINLNVHAATNPDDRPISGMRVEVIHKPGGYGKMGDFHAYYYENAASEEIDNQIDESEKKPSATRQTLALIRQRDAQREQGTYSTTSIIPTNSNITYKTHLNKDEFTFTPAGPKARYRLNGTQYSAHIYFAIQYLEDLQRKPDKIGGDAKKHDEYQRRLTEDILILKNIPLADYKTMSKSLKLRKAYGINESNYYNALKQMKDLSQKGVTKNPNPVWIRQVVPYQQVASKVSLDKPIINRVSSEAKYTMPQSTSCEQKQKPIADKVAVARQNSPAPMIPKAAGKPLSQLRHYYIHAVDNEQNGRYHFFSIEQSVNIKGNFSAMKGDYLKTHILEAFKTQIEQFPADTFEERVCELRNSDGFKLLKKGQGIATRLLSLTTSSVNAFEKMVLDKKALNEAKDQEAKYQLS